MVINEDVHWLIDTQSGDGPTICRYLFFLIVCAGASTSFFLFVSLKPTICLQTLGATAIG